MTAFGIFCEHKRKHNKNDNCNIVCYANRRKDFCSNCVDINDIKEKRKNKLQKINKI